MPVKPFTIKISETKLAKHLPDNSFPSKFSNQFPQTNGHDQLSVLTFSVISSPQININFTHSLETEKKLQKDFPRFSLSPEVLMSIVMQNRMREWRKVRLKQISLEQFKTTMHVEKIQGNSIENHQITMRDVCAILPVVRN